MANELIPRQQAVYPSNDMQITQSPLMVGAYAKSGAWNRVCRYVVWSVCTKFNL